MRVNPPLWLWGEVRGEAVVKRGREGGRESLVEVFLMME